MAKQLPSRPTFFEFILKLIDLWIEHQWQVLQSLIVLSVLTVSLYTIVSPKADDQAKKWAYGSMTTLTSVWIGTRLTAGQMGKRPRS